MSLSSYTLGINSFIFILPLSVFNLVLGLSSCSVACEVIIKIASQIKLYWKNSHAFKAKEAMNTETEPSPSQMKPAALAPCCYCPEVRVPITSGAFLYMQ